MDISFLIQLLLNGLVIGVIYALIAMGLSLIFGVLEIVNFAHGTLLAVSGVLASLAFASWGLHPLLIAALLAPLMFGFMFGDVAQGAIVALAGFFLGKRLPALRLLLPGGLVAIVFGFAFGSVFAREDVVPALWLHPLSQPLPVLAVALGFGVVTLVLGLALDALQYFWRGQLRHWLFCDVGLLVAYLGLVGAAIDLSALWLLPLGIAWSLAGAAFTTPAARITAVGSRATIM